MEICVANATDHTDGTGGTIGSIVCNASGKRAFGKGCDLCRVPRYDPMAFRDLHGGPAGICVADCTRRARSARPFVSRSHVMQVLLANFASAPRWIFTRGLFYVGFFAIDGTCFAALLTTGVLVLVGGTVGAGAIVGAIFA